MNRDHALEILAYIAKQGLHDSIWWRCDGEFSPITIFIVCNDQFYWATADLEKITADNFSVLKQAIGDAKNIDPVLGALRGCLLFCCRVRGMRPQQPAYPTDKPEWREIFDACGPERDSKDEG